MRLLWGSEHILCSDCGERTLTFPKLKKAVAQQLEKHELLNRWLGNRLRGTVHS
jgi:hypothetical protein